MPRLRGMGAVCILGEHRAIEPPDEDAPPERIAAVGVVLEADPFEVLHEVNVLRFT